MAINASGVRIGWGEIPREVRAGVEDLIGGEVVSTTSQRGGFSPGAANRVLTASGRRAFVKAVSVVQNERSPDMYRAEAHVVGHLPPNRHVPTLLGTYDDGTWIALVFDDVEASVPPVPWRPADIDAAVGALSDMAEEFTPNPVPGLAPIQTALGPLFAGWERVRDTPPADLDPWAHFSLDLLCRLAADGLADLGGATLVHNDIRADNLLLRPDGTVAVVDWPWACVGAEWLDRLALCINVDLYGGHDPERLVRRYLSSIDPDAITRALAGLCGFFTDVARQPPDLGLPTVRAFQRAQAVSTLRWLRRRCR